MDEHQSQFDDLFSSQDWAKSEKDDSGKANKQSQKMLVNVLRQYLNQFMEEKNRDEDGNIVDLDFGKSFQSIDQKYKYKLGVIDLLTEFDRFKMIESGVKNFQQKVKRQSQITVSAQNPEFYQQRFMEYFDKYF